MRFHDKVALITAAASGIGRATTDIIAQDGGIVVAVDNHEERLDRTVAQLNEAGGRAHRRLCNALDEKDVQATVGSIDDAALLCDDVGGGAADAARRRGDQRHLS